MIKAGGEAAALYLAWKHGHHDPFRLYHGLREDYCPLQGGEPRPPVHPWRLRMLLYAFAQQAQKDQNDAYTAIAGGSVTRRM